MGLDVEGESTSVKISLSRDVVHPLSLAEAGQIRWRQGSAEKNIWPTVCHSLTHYDTHNVFRV